MSKLEVKRSYNRLAVLAKRHKEETKRFLELCTNEYGFNFHDDERLKDSDKIIGTIDYGTDCLPFLEFDKMMETAKKLKMWAQFRG